MSTLAAVWAVVVTVGAYLLVRGQVRDVRAAGVAMRSVVEMLEDSNDLAEHRRLVVEVASDALLAISQEAEWGGRASSQEIADQALDLIGAERP